MGRPSKRKVQSRQAAALSAARTRKSRRLGDAELEPRQIESQLVHVQEAPSSAEAEDGSEGREFLEEEHEGGEHDEGRENAEEECGGEQENEYLQNLIASDSVPPNSEAPELEAPEPENQSPTVKNPVWPRVTSRQAGMLPRERC
jgi:hypothetical protein